MKSYSILIKKTEASLWSLGEQVNYQKMWFLVNPES